jgi:hypothetical protein
MKPMNVIHTIKTEHNKNEPHILATKKHHSTFSSGYMTQKTRPLAPSSPINQDISQRNQTGAINTSWHCAILTVMRSWLQP